MKASRRLALVILGGAIAACHADAPLESPTRGPLAGTPLASGEATISARDLRAHVEYLASDELAGRETLTEGYQKAARYLASAFARYGLAPLPSHRELLVSYTLWEHSIKEASLALTTPAGKTSVAIGESATPFDFSDPGAVDAEVVFAGYGITAPEHGRDDYAGLDVKGKWVLVLRHAPGFGDPKNKLAGSQYTYFMSKALNAVAHGARGMLLVTGPATAQGTDDFSVQKRHSVPLTETEKREREELIAKRAAAMEAQRLAAAKKAPRKRSKNALAAPAVSGPLLTMKSPSAPAVSGPLLAMHIAPAIAESLLASTGKTLAEVQAAIDAGQKPSAIRLVASARGTLTAQDKPDEVVAHNVIGFLEGSDPILKDEWIVIGGHFDHLGARSHAAHAGPAKTAEPASTPADTDAIFNGADDNASGTSAVLELAQAFASLPTRPKRSIVFMGFSGEEKGLLGSKALLKQGFDIGKVRFMLNLDMIGRNPEKPVELVGTKSATELKAIVDAANETIGVALEHGDYSGRSDHEPFYREEIPVAFFFTGFHDDYHGAQDHADKLSYQRMEDITRLSYRMAERLASGETMPQFVHQLAWLGSSVMTRSAATGDEAVLFEVEADSRASKAGLRDGDVIMTLNDAQTSDPRQIGRSLRDLEPKSRVKLGIVRDGQPLTIEIERAPRGYLGVMPGTLSDEERQKLRLTEDEGVAIAEVVENSPAAAAKLRAGDILVRIAGYAVNGQTLMQRLARIGAGEKIEVQVVRDGQRIDLPLTLGAPPER